MSERPRDTRDLERLTSRELHDKAVTLAVHRADVAFLWRLLRALPAAEAAAGRLRRAEADIMHVGALLNELAHAGEGEAAEELRPMYLEYLAEHGE